MRNCWEKLYISLVLQIDTKDSYKKFEQLKCRHEELVRFEDPSELKQYLNFNGGDLDEKDAIYSVLIREVQARNSEIDLATSLLWLGLWPGLRAIYRRQLKYFRKNPEYLVSEIGIHFSVGIHKADLSRINRVAATLVRNVERNIRADKQKTWKQQRRQKHAQSIDYAAIASKSQAPFESSRLGILPGLSVQQQVVEIEKRLTDIVGPDSSLIVDVAICEQSQREAGEQRGLKHDATRKRFQRGISRVRDYLEISEQEFVPLCPAELPFTFNPVHAGSGSGGAGQWQPLGATAR